jgi:hypothetical protein
MFGGYTYILLSGYAWVVDWQNNENRVPVVWNVIASTSLLACVSSGMGFRLAIAFQLSLLFLNFVLNANYPLAAVVTISWPIVVTVILALKISATCEVILRSK